MFSKETNIKGVIFMGVSTNQAFEALKEYMTANYNVSIVSGGREILKRCHFCGDSRDSTKAHMYIGVRNDGKICYNCFKCNAGGFVDGKFLRSLGCYDTSIISLCQEHNKINDNSSSSINNNKLLGVKNVRHLIIPNSSNEFAMKKLQYIQKRTGYVFSPADASRFKIVLNIKDFLDVNGITKYTRNPNMVDLIDKFFIGFLSMDNSYVIMRRLVPDGKLPEYIDYRYLNYDIFGGGYGTKFYTIPSAVNTTEKIDVHVAEGAFDILSIYLNLAPMGSNNIYGAICGKSYSSLIRHYILNYGLSGFDLHIYADADVGDSKFTYINNEIKTFGGTLFIHRNRFDGEKDYGVPLTNISDSMYKL